jgi:tRNA(adenine34) deaminase
MSKSPPSTAFMQMALAQARMAGQMGEVPVGAVVVKDNQVIAVGHNQPIGTHDPTAHAEIVALRAAAQLLGNYRLDGCSLYVTLEPCAMCTGAILEARVEHVFYGALEPKTGAAGSVINLFGQPLLNHHTAVTSGVLEAECSDLLTGFFSARRQEHKLLAQPLREDGLRTPPHCFASVEARFPESRYLRVGNDDLRWRVHYADVGPEHATTCVVLVHDVPGWGYRWHALAPKLTQAGYRVMVPDLIGFGRSDKPKKKQAHSLSLHFQCLDAIRALVPLKSRMVLIGQGVGLMLAHQWTLDRLGQVEVIAIAPSPAHEADTCPYPDRGFMAGVEFFSHWAQSQPDQAAVRAAKFALDTPQHLLAHLNSDQGIG